MKKLAHRNTRGAKPWQAFAVLAGCILSPVCCPLLFAQPPLSDLDRELLDDLSPPKPAEGDEGEDVGGESAREDPLANELGRLSAEMRAIGGRLRLDAADSQEPLAEVRSRQDRIAADLAKLIAELERQSQGGASSSAASSASSASQAASPMQSADRAETATNDDASRASDGAASDAVASPDLKANVWGHLPQRWRKQMSSGAAIEFLPRYRDAIEEYYRRLATPNPPE